MTETELYAKVVAKRGDLAVAGIGDTLEDDIDRALVRDYWRSKLPDSVMPVRIGIGWIMLKIMNPNSTDRRA